MFDAPNSDYYHDFIGLTIQALGHYSGYSLPGPLRH